MNINELIDQRFQAANDKLSLYDVFYADSDAKQPLVIFAHGFKGFKDWGHWPILCKLIAEAGYVVVKFNFSHNGVGLGDKMAFDDLESFSLNNYSLEQEDFDRLIQHLENDELMSQIVDFKKINLIGHSRGGSMAILKGAKSKKIKNVISWAAVADLVDRLPKGAEMEEWRSSGVRMIPNSRTGQQMPVNYQFVEDLMNNQRAYQIEKEISKLKDHLLIIQGEADKTVELEHGFALHVWNSKATFVTIPTADHTFGGRHPFDNILPKESRELIEHTLAFLAEKN